MLGCAKKLSIGAALSCGLWGTAGAGLGCGARAMVEPSADDDTVVDGVAGAGSAGSGAGGRGGAPQVEADPGEPDDGDGMALPACEPGFVPSDGSRDCPFLSAGRCYATLLAACACACPEGGQSSCVSGGFLNPDEPQDVTCIGR